MPDAEVAGAKIVVRVVQPCRRLNDVAVEQDSSDGAGWWRRWLMGGG